MDAKKQYEELTKKLNANLPLKAFPVRELLPVFKKNKQAITLKTRLTITDVFNSGDISGIMCTVSKENDNVIVCGLTHLIFSPECSLFKEISDYQIKREMRIRELNNRRF